MTRTAIYARYSSDNQSEASIEDQVRVCSEHAKRFGLDIVEVYSDYAISGSHLGNRPSIKALMDQVRSGGIELVLSEALDRISRDQEDIAAIYKRLTYHGVRLVTLAEGEINELHVGLKGTMNALFLKDLAAKTRRGQRGRVEAGKIPGGNSYGYQIIRELRTDGSVTAGEREVDEAEAAIVRRIFAEYAQGLAPRQIAGRLNREGVPSPRGGQWNASTINGSRQRRNGILNNELYIGRIAYNRQRFLKNPETGRRIARPNPPHEWTVTEAPHLQIVDLETWEAVQAIKARYASKWGNKRQTKKRLLTGLIKCGACGGSMTIINRERYACSAKRERGTCTSPVGIAAAEIEARVMDGLKDILLGRQELIEEFAQAFKAELDQLRRQHTQDRTRLERELARVQASIRRCLKFITEGNDDPGLVRDELTGLDRRRKELERVIAHNAQPQEIVIHPNIAELYRRKVLELQSLLAEETARYEAMELIRSMVDRIEVHIGERRGKPQVILVGALAQILEYACQENKCAASGDGGGGRVLMVAGVGFEPTTFRL